MIGAHDSREGAVKIYQDVNLYTSTLDAGDTINYEIAAGRYSWVQVARGIIMLNGNELREGDGVQLVGAKALTIEAQTGTELLLFDLA